MSRELVLIFAAACGFAVAQQARPTADACVPPPGSVPPSLPAKLLEGQGVIHFPITTTSKEAQAFFNQGVAQMHSFWAREAERSFLQAAALDPSAPMPQWGIAMVAAGDYRPGFQLDLVDGRTERPRRGGGAPRGGELRAVEAAKKALELAAVEGKATPLEKLYIESIAARRDRASKNGNAAYVEGLRRLLASYPAEVEARSYLALQIMSGFVLPEKKPRPGSMEAVALLRALMSEAPDHPGVHHYVIHGFEGSAFAPDAWPSCKRYAELSPNIPHALHMPGHIYAQTGRWDDASAAFAAAAKNEIYWMREDSLAGNGHHGHNVHFLATSHSFAGRLDEALKAARGLLEFKENPREAATADNHRTAYRQGWFALMRAYVQHERWDDILGGAIPEMDKPRQRAWLHWSRGLAYAAKSELAPARREAELMEKALEDLKKLGGEPGSTDAPALALDELKAHLLLADGKNDDALKAFRAAADRERSLRYNEPPAYPRPILEVLGWAASRSGHPEMAEQAFREALSQYPASAGALAGLKSIGRPIQSGF